MYTAVAPFSIETLLKRAMPKIARVCAKHLDPERLFRLAVSAGQRDPKLVEAIQAAPETFLRAVFYAGRLGLELDAGPLGGAHLVPRWNSRNKRREVGVVIDYRGLVDLASRSGSVVPGGISAHAVRENDVFDYRFGSSERIKHIPALRDPGELVAVYAVARLTDGSVRHEIMRRDECEAIRDRFHKEGDFSPWSTDFERMCLKSVVRRICNLLPKSVEVGAALALQASDETGDNSFAGIANELLDGDKVLIEATVDRPDEAPRALPDSAPQTVTPPRQGETVEQKRSRARANRAPAAEAHAPSTPPASAPASTQAIDEVTALAKRLGNVALAGGLLEAVKSAPNTFSKPLADAVFELAAKRLPDLDATLNKLELYHVSEPTPVQLLALAREFPES